MFASGRATILEFCHIRRGTFGGRHDLNYGYNYCEHIDDGRRTNGLVLLSSGLRSWVWSLVYISNVLILIFVVI